MGEVYDISLYFFLEKFISVGVGLEFSENSRSEDNTPSEGVPHIYIVLS